MTFHFDPTEEMLVAGLREVEPLGALINWQQGFGRKEMKAAFLEMIAVSKAGGGMDNIKNVCPKCECPAWNTTSTRITD